MSSGAFSLTPELPVTGRRAWAGLLAALACIATIGLAFADVPPGARFVLVLTAFGAVPLCLPEDVTRLCWTGGEFARIERRDGGLCDVQFVGGWIAVGIAAMRWRTVRGRVLTVFVLRRAVTASAWRRLCVHLGLSTCAADDGSNVVQ